MIFGFGLKVVSDVLEAADRGVGGSAKTPLYHTKAVLSTNYNYHRFFFSFFLFLKGGGVAGQEGGASD